MAERAPATATHFSQRLALCVVQVFSRCVEQLRRRVFTTSKRQHAVMALLKHGAHIESYYTYDRHGDVRFEGQHIVVHKEHTRGCWDSFCMGFRRGYGTS